MLTTRRRVLIVDQLSTILITVVGLSVILAVAGMMVFLVSSSWPLFRAETFTEAGRIPSTQEKVAGLMVDKTAPIAVLLPQTSAGCFLQTSLVESKRVTAKQNIRLRLSHSTQTEKPWTLQSDSEPTLSGENTLSCVTNESDGTLLVRRADSLSALSVKIIREFLSADETGKLDVELKKNLTEARWILTPDNTLLVKPSAQSPVAKLSLGLEEEWSLPDFFKQNPLATLEGVSFIRKPGKAEGLIVSVAKKSSLDSPEATQFFLLSASENAITGEKTTALRALQLSSPSRSSTQLQHFKLAWIEGRFLIVPLENGTFASIDSEDANLKESILTLPSSAGAIARWSPAFGGAAALAELRPAANAEPNTKNLCWYLDVGRATRQALASDTATAEMQSLWEDTCRSSERVLVHPHKRVLFRILEQAQKDTLTVEARELTTGRISAEMKLPKAALTSLNVDTHGDLLSWQNPETGEIFVTEYVAPHVEVSLKSLFGKIRYESYENASYSWQSTSGTDEFQAKFSLVPLIWGTFKATLYSLLFAVPLAIFAAIYSSEILDRQTRNVVKPTLEMMASVPSVVLGFLAAIIVAPWVEAHIVSVLLIGTSMPFLLYVTGVFLQVPSARHLTTRGLYASRRLLMWVILGFAGMLWLLTRAGLLIERTAFGGDLKAFLSGGPGIEGVLWGFLILPLVFVGLWSLPIRRARNLYRVAVFLIGPVLAVTLGRTLAGHTELRADLLGEYAQRNTLVISIAMGFAIIPIIYSLAEDALTSVPNSLRAGSLACGASVWQTTARVVLPTAASGLFSAVMVGLGRGIGETMIAVMATGNTAVMTTNPFDGLRSMAANIAVELPEAAQGSTHYRILFLSALALFMFTFTLNSFAELLRARYRARNKAL